MKSRLFIIAGTAILLLVVGGVFYFGPDIPGITAFGTRTIEIEGAAEDTGDEGLVHPPHPLSGIRCENHDRRPMAVMLPEDFATRPLSGISKADVIVEMPVVKKRITRMMALFACQQPEEIGSIRSARHDFIPLAAGFDSVYAHWGGSHHALDELKTGVLDNIDALINPYNVFYRKSAIARPHNGFTSYERLYDTAEKLGYRLTTDFEGYSRAEEQAKKDADNTTVSVGYAAPYNVHYVYDKGTNSYLRWRGGQPETDALDGEQVELKVLVVARAASRMLDNQYIDVDIQGSGEGFIFQNGKMRRVTWEKPASPLDSKLVFKDEDGKEVPVVAGKMWVHIVDPDTEIKWGEEVL